jgi:hypothetical protein
MPLLGSAAMLLSFDVLPQAVAEHDHWHTHEHLPERLAIPGFLRGTRWVALRGGPRYCVLYEVASLQTLSSPAYLERLNRPSPWTARMMPHYRGMRRGFCAVSGSFGLGLGHVAMLLRFKPAESAAPKLRRWLMEELLPALPGRPGLGGAHLLEGAAMPVMTTEQRIRGVDAGVDWAVVISGYEQAALADPEPLGLSESQLEARGACDVEPALYRLDYTLSASELGPQRVQPPAGKLQATQPPHTGNT